MACLKFDTIKKRALDLRVLFSYLTIEALSHSLSDFTTSRSKSSPILRFYHFVQRKVTTTGHTYDMYGLLTVFKFTVERGAHRGKKKQDNLGIEVGKIGES